MSLARLGKRQKDGLINLIEDNFEYMQGRHTTARGASNKKATWDSIAANLNAMGPLIKTREQWQKLKKLITFNTLKYSAKDKLKLIRTHRNRSGMAPKIIQEFS